MAERNQSASSHLLSRTFFFIPIHILMYTYNLYALIRISQLYIVSLSDSASILLRSPLRSFLISDHSLIFLIAFSNTNLKWRRIYLHQCISNFIELYQSLRHWLHQESSLEAMFHFAS
jgi:hypothetical protein